MKNNEINTRLVLISRLVKAGEYEQAYDEEYKLFRDFTKYVYYGDFTCWKDLTIKTKLVLSSLKLDFPRGSDSELE